MDGCKGGSYSGWMSGGRRHGGFNSVGDENISRHHDEGWRERVRSVLCARKKEVALMAQERSCSQTAFF